MFVILLLLAMFVPAVCFSQTLNIEKFEVRREKAIIPLLIGIALVSVAVGIYTFLQMRKMQKKNQPKPNQLDGTIADEGTSFCDIAGSPHVHANITDIWGKSTQAIKKKSGGFLGIGKTSQVTGYRYYAKFAAFIGNRIEKLIAINFDNRKWVLHDPTKHPVNMLPVREGSLFGGNEGGVAGDIDIHFGYPDQDPNLEYQKYFPLVSGYPYQSYLLFRGHNFQDSFLGHTFTTPAFYLGNSGYMKEMLLWVKRTRVRNDGQEQWYEVRGDGAVVCEIGSRVLKPNANKIQLNIPLSGSVSWVDPSGIHRRNYSSGNLPFYDISKSHDANGEPMLVSPSIIASSTFLSANGVSIQPGDGTVIPECDFSDYPPHTDGFWNGAIDRRFVFQGAFFWGGGEFRYEAYLSENNAGVLIDKKINDDWVTVHMFGGNLGDGFYRIDGQVKLDASEYRITVDTGDRYAHTNTPRPLVAIYVYAEDQGVINSPDINPIHKIREILTDDTAMAKSEVDVNDINFMKAADRIWDEGLGISWAIDEKSCVDAIEELCYHIEAGIRVNRQTGLYEMVLFRDDWFTENEIHAIAENKIKDLSLEVMNSDDIVNQLNVTYYDRERIKNSTFSIYENGSILTMGKANAESIDFPYFMNMRNAEVVANWKLKQYSTPAWKGTFTTGWREARKWNRYDLVEITWSKKWQGTILARIMKIDLGNGLSNEVVIDFEEVVPYSGEMNTSIVVDDSTEEKAEPAKPAIGETFEAPYYIAVQNIGQRKLDEELAYNQDVGFTFSTYRRPQWNALYAEITTANVDKPEDGWIVDGNAEFVTSGQFDQLVSRTMTQIPVKNLQIEGSLNQGDLIVVGSWIIGNVGQYEFMIIESFDAETSILTVKRGALDTIPFEWGVDTNFWLSNPENGLFSLTEYSADQNVRASALTVTPSSKLEHLGSAPVYMRSRAIRPYPPANVKINGEYFPDDIETDLVITWSDRNRLDLSVADWYSPGVAIEPNTQTHLIISQLDEDQIVVATSNVNVTGATSYTMPISSMQADTRFVKVTLKTVRDDYECLQPFEHIFELSQFFSAPYDLTVEFKND
ncbi:hypothetical protein [Acinetobacter indicus]|uniref:hypothetical protein n=1 Tax=Acinetobacter indicus TaxID=756892 RepID=UPI002E34E31F|nr:hypothetical protein [Acinetobacter indicus]